MQGSSIGLSLRILSLPDQLRGSDKDLLMELQKSLVQSSNEALRAPTSGLTVENADGSLDCLQALWVEPASSHYSRFFGQSQVPLAINLHLYAFCRTGIR